MPLSASEQDWYFSRIRELDTSGNVVSINESDGLLVYNSSLPSDESNQRSVTPEEVVHALAVCLLTNNEFKYSLEKLYHEKYYAHGRKGTLSDEVDLLIYDDDELPYAMWEFKSAEKYEAEQEDAIKLQLFGTAPLVGAPRLLVYSTIKPNGATPALTLVCIDYSKYKSYESWLEAGKPSTNIFPKDYQEPGYEPLTNGGDVDLRLNCTQAEFRTVATIFHNEFFAEHPDNVLYINLVKCLLAKIYDEKQTKKGERYEFQIYYRNGKEESANEVFNRVNERYSTAYKRYIDPAAPVPDEINPKEFPPERVKTIVKVLQSMSITRGAAVHGDVIGAFFEEILRTGFKQERGMYFTHDNLVSFMIEAADVRGLTLKTWKNATHPENRLPYIIDPACGSGTFLLKTMNVITETIKKHKAKVVVDLEAEQFYNARLSDSMPNYWAENFLYGLDPKFVMAITAKVNMVLHGDGSAHIFKQDAFKPLSTFTDSKFRPVGEPSRTIPKSRYKYDICETFDLAISNPPFGITLASDTKLAIPKTFWLTEAKSSEALFLERCFQLLKPNGRLALVVPESLLNTAESIDVRLLLYRTFWIRTIVSLPRNLFVDTPTLTSLLFAQKKTTQEITEWDIAWENAYARANQKIQQTKAYLQKTGKKKKNVTVLDVQNNVLSLLSPIVTEDTWILKRGKKSELLSFSVPQSITNVSDAVNYYKAILKFAGFNSIVETWVFNEITPQFDYEYPVFIVDEVGYKLSKRKERPRPNQLCRFVGIDSQREQPNLHLTDEPIEIIVDAKNPQRILDYIRKYVQWS